MNDLVDRWDVTKDSVLAFVRALPAGSQIALEGGPGGFGVRDCAFDGEVFFSCLFVTNIEAPRRATLTFYTGFPDGYVTFELVIEEGELTGLKAFCA